ncbi:MAG: redox-sensing transcriptional repressor Rex [Deltaproteobacteria bacterium]|nr:redox-sensing transcriptional repressor Rex [Deltaproteobacteria bacterium]
MSPRTLKIDKLPTIRRLPNYLKILRGLSAKGEEFVSSAYLAEQMHIDAILVRKDLELTGISGTPRVGFRIQNLIVSIEHFLGWGKTLDACLVGAGQLGAALLGHRDLSKHGVRIVAAFDDDPDKSGTTVHGVPVFPCSRLSELLQRLAILLAIVCVPAEVAQQVTDLLVQAGIQAIWIFTSENITVPENIIMQKEDLLSGLAVLSSQLTRRGNSILPL